MKLVLIAKLNQHEEIDRDYLVFLKKAIQKDGFIKNPIIADKEYLVVLDGHHRLNSCKALGLSRIPCQLVDYLGNNKIRVVTRRKGIYINKQIVIAMGISGKVFPEKTTKHFIPKREKEVNVGLNRLF